MIKLSLDFSLINVDVEGYSREMRENAVRLIREGAKEFLKAAAVRVRVRTGFAHGSLGTLAKFLRTSLPPGRPGTRPRQREYYYERGRARVLKSRTAGLGYTTRPEEIIKQEKFGGVRFQFDINIKYYLRNDTLGHPSGRYSPWESYRYGFFAMLSYIEETAPDVFPSFAKYVTLSKTNA